MVEPGYRADYDRRFRYGEANDMNVRWRTWLPVLEERVPVSLSESERCAVVELDRGLRRYAGRLLLYATLFLALLASGLYATGNGKLTLLESIAASLGLLVCLTALVIGAWARPASFATRPARKILMAIVLAMLGGLVGGYLAEPGGWNAYLQHMQRIGYYVVFGAGLVGLMMAGLGTGLGLLRHRENLAVEARVRSESEARLREEQLAHNLAEARLAVLQAQVEPHFLFNSLGAVVELSEGKAPEAAELCQHLVEFLRGSLAGLRAGSTTLGADLDVAASYLEVMSIRLGDRLSWSVDAPAELRGAMLPAAMTISLVENAIKHGIEPWAQPASIRVVARAAGDQLLLIVEDTGRGLVDPRGEGLGLSNIRERLHLQFPQRSDVTLEPHQPRGTRAILRLPLQIQTAA